MTAVTRSNQRQQRKATEVVIRKPQTQTQSYRLRQQQQQQEAPAAPAPGTPPTTDPPAAEPPASDASSAATDPPRNGKVIAIPSAKMASIKREAKEKGRREALASLDATARELGYASHEDMVQKLRANKGRRPAAPTARTAPPPESDDNTDDSTPPAPVASRRRETRTERELTRAQEQRRAANRARAAAEKRAKQLERQREADSAENELKLAAVGAGVKDVDYALVILRRKLQGKTEDELAKFDEDKFFKDELRRTHPYLYTVQEEPVTTSPPADPANPGKQAPAATPPKAPASGDKKDGRTMSKAEYNETLSKRGFVNPSVGS